MQRTTAIGLGTLGVAGALAASLALASAPPRKAEPARAIRPATPPKHPTMVSASPAKAAAGADAPAAPASFVVKRILRIDHPLRFGEFHWDDTGVPAGAMTITIDLGAETMSVWRGGYEIGAAAVIYGLEGKDTPVGTFPIMAKNAVHFSSIYNRAPMPWMLRLTGDGVSIHGSDMKAGYATHGCIGVPNGFAKRVFGEVSVGDRVIITRNKTMDMNGKA